MITEKDLQEAILECHGQRKPDSSTCLKLASYYTILDHMKVKTEDPVPEQYMTAYSFDAAPEYSSETEFGQAVKKNGAESVLKITDELMETLRVIHPRLYRAFIRKISTLEK